MKRFDTKHRKRLALVPDETLMSLLEMLPDALFLIDDSEAILYANARAQTIAGATPKELLGNQLWRCASHLVSPSFFQAVQKVKQTQEWTEVQYVSPGTQTWLHVQLAPTVGGLLLQFHSAGTENAASKQAEEELRALIDSIPQFVWIGRPDGSMAYANRQWGDYASMTVEQTQGDEWIHRVHPDDRPRVLSEQQRSIQTGMPMETETRLRHEASGAYRWFLIRSVSLKDSQDVIRKWFGTATDIDEQKQVEEALRQSQEHINVLMNSSIIGIFISQAEQIVEANDTFLRMSGYSREDLRGQKMNWVHMTPPEYLARTQQAHQELARHQSIQPYEKEYMRQDGSRLPVLVGGVVLPFDPSHNICFVLDNSARKELEQRKDDFINMASHELKTPLTAVKLQTQLVRKRLERQFSHEVATALSRVEEPVRQLERLIGELLDVSKIQAGNLEYRMESVDLNALLQDITDTLQQSSPGHTIVVHGTTQVSLIGDRDRLGQVFANLISNAIKYSPDAEKVEIDLSTTEDAVTIRVRDHGLGIPQEQQDKIFERFYRVKGFEQSTIPGLGMGLYIVAEIVKQHGGTITVDSEVGKGATFQVTLPPGSA